jgi:hypothetical protein
MIQDYYVGWGTLALINAGLAQSKNRSRLNWFLLSLLIGPLYRCMGYAGALVQVSLQPLRYSE